MTPFLNTSVVLPVSDPSQIGEARRTAASLAARIGLNETQAGTVSLIVTEAATNLQKHAGGGHILLRPLQEQGRLGLEVIAIDGGPGMPDIARCLEDGYSTKGTPGTGLGSIKRLATVLEIYSLPGVGTVVLAQVWNQAPPETGLQIGAVCAPAPGETLCGDSWAVREAGGRLFVLMVDGLGHGALAAQAAGEAVDLFQRDPLRNPTDVLQSLHLGLRATRGAAVMVLQVDLATGAVLCAGVGNISARLLGPGGDRSFVSQNGIVGHQVKRFQEFSYTWEKSALLVLHSDGLQTRFSYDRYPGLAVRHPGVAAALLQRDFRRERDDSTLLILRRR